MFNHFPVIRLYAPGDSGGDAAGDDNQDQNQNPDGDLKGDPKGDDPPKVPTFAEMLKDKGFASDLDKHVAKAINTAKGKWDEEAKLSADELAKKKVAEQDAALSKREADLAARELKADMATEIGKRTLPATLIDAVSLTDKDAAMASLDKVEKAFRTAVDDAVKEKLKGNPPPAGGGEPTGSFEQKIRAAVGLKNSK